MQIFTAMCTQYTRNDAPNSICSVNLPSKKKKLKLYDLSVKHAAVVWGHMKNVVILHASP